MTEDDSYQSRRPSAGSARWLAVGAALVVALVAALALGGGGTQDCTLPGVRPAFCPIPAGDRVAAPTLAWPVLGDDTEIGLGDHAGDVIVLNFWASWCGPCRSEQPQLIQARSDLADLGVTFLGVNETDSSEANGLAFEAEFAIPYPSLYDPDGRYAAAFEGAGPRVMPSTLLIDRQGRIAVTILGETGYDEVVGLATELATS